MIGPNFHQIPNSLPNPRFRILRFLLLPSLTATAVLLSGALAQQPSSSQPSSAAIPAKSDPTAEQTLA